MTSHSEYHSVLRELTKQQCSQIQSQFNTRGERRVAQHILLADAYNVGKQPSTRLRGVFYLEEPLPILHATMEYGYNALTNNVAHYGVGHGREFLDSYGWHVGAGLPTYADEQVMRALFKRDTVSQAAAIGGTPSTTTSGDMGTPDKANLTSVLFGFVLNPDADFTQLIANINVVQSAFSTNPSAYATDEIASALSSITKILAQIDALSAGNQDITSKFASLRVAISSYKSLLENPPIGASAPSHWSSGWGDAAAVIAPVGAAAPPDLPTGGFDTASAAAPSSYWPIPGWGDTPAIPSANVSSAASAPDATRQVLANESSMRAVHNSAAYRESVQRNRSANEINALRQARADALAETRGYAPPSAHMGVVARARAIESTLASQRSTQRTPSSSTHVALQIRRAMDQDREETKQTEVDARAASLPQADEDDAADTFDDARSDDDEGDGSGGPSRSSGLGWSAALSYFGSGRPRKYAKVKKVRGRSRSRCRK